jgi:hypothetical protein
MTAPRDVASMPAFGAYFGGMPTLAAYLVTDPYGTIMEANAAATLLLSPSAFGPGACAASLRAKALDLFIPLEQRGVFRGKLAAVAAGAGAQRAAWRGGLRCAHADVNVEFTVGRIRHRALPMVSLCWLIRPL